MPLLTTYDRISGTTICTATGVLRGEILLAEWPRGPADSRPAAGGRWFCDLANVDRFEINDNAATGAPQPGPGKSAGNRCAILVFHPAGSGSFRRFIVARTTDADVRFFIDRHEAVAWLNEGRPRDHTLTVAATLQGIRKLEARTAASPD